jgi:hypothetical protein
VHDSEFSIHKPGTLAGSGQGQTTPEHEPAVLFERLPPIDRLKAHAMLCQPLHRGQRFVYQHLLFNREILAVIKASKIGCEVRPRIGPEISQRESSVVWILQ